MNRIFSFAHQTPRPRWYEGWNKHNKAVPANIRGPRAQRVDQRIQTFARRREAPILHHMARITRPIRVDAGRVLTGFNAMDTARLFVKLRAYYYALHIGRRRRYVDIPSEGETLLPNRGTLYTRFQVYGDAIQEHHSTGFILFHEAMDLYDLIAQFLQSIDREIGANGTQFYLEIMMVNQPTTIREGQQPVIPLRGPIEEIGRDVFEEADPGLAAGQELDAQLPFEAVGDFGVIQEAEDVEIVDIPGIDPLMENIIALLDELDDQEEQEDFFADMEQLAARLPRIPPQQISDRARRARLRAFGEQNRSRNNRLRNLTVTAGSRMRRANRARMGSRSLHRGGEANPFGVPSGQIRHAPIRVAEEPQDLYALGLRARQRDPEQVERERMVAEQMVARQLEADEEAAFLRMVRMGDDRRVADDIFDDDYMDFVFPEEGAGMRGEGFELLDEDRLVFYKKSLQDRFLNGDAVKATPVLPEGVCVFMAFLKCEVRKYNWGENVPYNKRIEYKHIRTLEDVETELVLPLADPVYPEKWRENSVHMVNRGGVPHLRFFNLYQDPQEDEQTWKCAAQELMHLIEDQRGPFVDHGDLGESLAALSSLFDVVIAVYDLNIWGKRLFAVTPDQREFHEYIAQEESVHVISMLYDHGHIHAITDLNAYFGLHMAKRIRAYGYCFLCEKRNQKWNQKEAAEHQSLCYHRVLQQKQKRIESEISQDHVTKLQEEQGYCPYKEKYIPEKKRKEMVCVHCNKECPNAIELMFHECKISAMGGKGKVIKEEMLYVYDIESSQESFTKQMIQRGKKMNVTSYYHACNLVCFRKVYPQSPEEEKGLVFDNEYAFMDHLLDPKHKTKYHNAVILAHNGGSYDHQFLIRYLERMQIKHDFIPSPNSLHKYLQVTVEIPITITFLDFIYFMPGSLKNIGKTLSLDNVAKGDFPHRFNTAEHKQYVGRLPIIDHENDYWCIKQIKKKSQLDAFKEFYREMEEEYCTCDDGMHTCNKKLWNMREQLETYCMMDVVVLAEGCRHYRNQMMQMCIENQALDQVWKPPVIDPFQFLTGPQISLHLLLSGYQGESVFKSNVSKERMGQSVDAMLWVYYHERRLNKKLYSRYRWHREYFDMKMQQYADAYDIDTGKRYVCMDCSYWCCPCQNLQDKEKKHYIFKDLTLEQVQKKGKDMYDLWRYHYADYDQLEIVWQHEVQPLLQTQLYPSLPCSERYFRNSMKISKDVDFFYGGRVETFSLYANAQKLGGDVIKYLDVCSLYPYVCAKKTLPCGTPIHIIGPEVERELVNHPDEKIAYWGYMRCKVRPNPHCRLGLLPQRTEEGRLRFSLEVQEGCWGTEELRVALSQGYEMLEVYEVYHWPPERRSCDLFAPFIAFFLKQKQQCEGWKKLGASCEDPSEEEKDEVVERLYHANGCLGRIDKTQVKINPVGRQLAKIQLNSTWGKFAQKKKTTKTCTLYGAQNFFELWNNPKVDRHECNFREISQGVYKCKFGLYDEFVPNVCRGNIFLAAKVTEHARCVLHRQMIKVGPERVLYCDTDSMVFTMPPEHVQPLIGFGLGEWTDECPGQTIERFYALAPKMYMLKMANSEGLEVKAKGVQLTLGNLDRYNEVEIRKLLDYECNVDTCIVEKPKMIMENMTIRPNCVATNPLHYGVMLTHYNEKQVSLTLTKRVIQKKSIPDWDTLDRIDTLPYYTCHN